MMTGSEEVAWNDTIFLNGNCPMGRCHHCQVQSATRAMLSDGVKPPQSERLPL